MSKNTNIADLINYISVDGSGNVVLTTGGQIATQSYVATAVSNLVNAAPSTLDTLNELAAALGNDANFATTVTTSIATKQAQLNGTGFVKVSGTTVSYDNSTYLTTTSASSNYVTLSTLQTISGLKTFDATISANYGIALLNGAIPALTSIYYAALSGNSTGISITYRTGGGINYTNNLNFPDLNNSYLFPSTSGTLALTSSLSAYLPLTGGTLTGALNGTSATFSGAATTGIDLSSGTYSYSIDIANNDFIRQKNFSGSLGLLVGMSTDDNLYLRGFNGLRLQVNNGTNALSITSTGAATFSSNISVNGSLTKITPTGVDGVYDNFIKYIYSSDVDARPNRWNGIDSTVTAGVAGANVLRFRVYQGASAQDQPPLTVMEMAGNGWVSIYNRLNIEFNGAILNLRNQSTGLNANYQLGNNLTSNGAGMALFGSGFTTSGQYRQAGAYFYSNQAGGVTIHAENANSIFLATNNSTAIFIDSAQRVGIGISNQLGTSKLSLGTGIGPKFLVYDNGSSVFAGLGQDVAAGNSTDLFCHGVSNLGFLTFGRLGTNGSSYTEWARFDTSGNFNMNGGQIRQGGIGIVQIVPIGPNRSNIPYTNTINAQYSIGNTGIPSNARWLLADVFITANISDHQNFMLTRQNFGIQKNWVDTRGNNPDSEFGNLTQDDVAILTYNGEADGYTPNYGIWKSSVLIPSSGRNIWINNYGNSNSSGYILFIVRGYSL